MRAAVCVRTEEGCCQAGKEVWKGVADVYQAGDEEANCAVDQEGAEGIVQVYSNA